METGKSGRMVKDFYDHNNSSSKYPLTGNLVSLFPDQKLEDG